MLVPAGVSGAEVVAGGEAAADVDESEVRLRLLRLQDERLLRRRGAPRHLSNIST